MRVHLGGHEIETFFMNDLRIFMTIRFEKSGNESELGMRFQRNFAINALFFIASFVFSISPIKL